MYLSLNRRRARSPGTCTSANRRGSSSCFLWLLIFLRSFHIRWLYLWFIRPFKVAIGRIKWLKLSPCITCFLFFIPPICLPTHCFCLFLTLKQQVRTAASTCELAAHRWRHDAGIFWEGVSWRQVARPIRRRQRRRQKGKRKCWWNETCRRCSQPATRANDTVNGWAEWRRQLTWFWSTETEIRPNHVCFHTFTHTYTHTHTYILNLGSFLLPHIEVINVINLFNCWVSVDSDGEIRFKSCDQDLITEASCLLRR